ncbi:sigma factor-like helix-turn-helix DNA-binding protein [Microvirga sp. GCM10011540]|uniref:sigma factor-like helix-turn-helix DNA-binding protein n=1 Tax=Microvirga sp. GCM10011540 TaxID=3317338 RepID=UPI003608E95E
MTLPRLKKQLHAALPRLPREQREAVLLIGVEGTAYEEAAEVLGVKVGMIKSRVNRARTRLAELLGLSGAMASPPTADRERGRKRPLPWRQPFSR